MRNNNKKKQFYIETYGCQMNKYDSELVANILAENGYTPAARRADADLILRSRAGNLIIVILMM